MFGIVILLPSRVQIKRGTKFSRLSSNTVAYKKSFWSINEARKHGHAIFGRLFSLTSYVSANQFCSHVGIFQIWKLVTPSEGLWPSMSKSLNLWRQIVRWQWITDRSDGDGVKNAILIGSKFQVEFYTTSRSSEKKLYWNEELGNWIFNFRKRSITDRIRMWYAAHSNCYQC